MDSSQPPSAQSPPSRARRRPRRPVQDMSQKAVSFAERNVAASFEFAQKLTHAKDAQEVMKLHADYVKAQMQALTEQARELGQTAAKVGQGRASD